MDKRYTVKRDGRYWSGDLNRVPRFGFIATHIGSCYSMSLENARDCQNKHGGEVVEVISLGNFQYKELPVPKV